MRSTESFSGFPYAIALYNCLLYTWYGSPLISDGWDNIVFIVVNAIGLLLECCFVCIYLTFAPPKAKVLSHHIIAHLQIVAIQESLASNWHTFNPDQYDLIHWKHLAVDKQLMLNEYSLQRKMTRMVMGVLLVFGTIAMASVFAVHDHNHKKVVVGTAGIVSTVILYGSPLSVIVSYT